MQLAKVLEQHSDLDEQTQKRVKQKVSNLKTSSGATSSRTPRTRTRLPQEVVERLKVLVDEHADKKPTFIFKKAMEEFPGMVEKKIKQKINNLRTQAKKNSLASAARTASAASASCTLR